MDYEKKYKEALEVMRQWIAPCHTKEQLDTLKKSVFPQLAESEDERMIKRIIDIFEYDKKHYLKEISWLEKQLEKQKENPKSADSIPSDCVSNAKCEDRSPKHTDSFGTDIRDTPAYWRGWDDAMKQKEQKPAEWDDYTKINLARALQIIKNAKGKLQGYQSDDGIYECDKAIEALEHFLYRGLEIEKPAEWSEEDEDMLNSCISSIEEAKENRYAYKENDGDTSYDREINWLKSLRPQPQHRDTYYDIIHNILDMLKDMDFMKITPEHRVSLLNDIRVKCKNADECAAILDEPHWKPSEEQMEAFRSYIKDFQDRAEAAVGGWNNFDVMIRLFEQLKKLM